jgi:DNA invertase Pin-like site-specific DNA recombinase
VNQTVTAALYVRGSMNEIDLRNQLDPLQQLAAARGWRVVVYEETETGDDERARRPVFERLLGDARRGVVRVVAVAGLDRLSRRGKRLVELFDDFEKWNVLVVSLREGDRWTELDAPIRRMVVGVIGMVAEMEMLNLRARTRAGLDKARRHGTDSGLPIGRQLKPAALLHEAARLMTAEGLSLRKAVARVNRGLPKKPEQPGGLCQISVASLHRFLEGTWEGLPGAAEARKAKAAKKGATPSPAAS